MQLLLMVCAVAAVVVVAVGVPPPAGGGGQDPTGDVVRGSATDWAGYDDFMARAGQVNVRDSTGKSAHRGMPVVPCLAEAYPPAGGTSSTTATERTYRGISVFNVTGAVTAIRVGLYDAADLDGGYFSMFVNPLQSPVGNVLPTPDKWVETRKEAAAAVLPDVPGRPGWYEHTFASPLVLHENNLTTIGFETAGALTFPRFNGILDFYVACTFADGPGTLAVDTWFANGANVDSGDLNSFLQYDFFAVYMLEYNIVPFCTGSPLLPGQSTSPVFDPNVALAGSYNVSCASGTPAYEEVICQGSGEWTANDHCLCVPSTLPAPGNGSVAQGTDATGRTTMHMSCPIGWHSPGNPVFNYTCTVGVWVPDPFTPEYPECVIRTCPTISPQAGRVLSTTTGEYGTVGTGSCSTGYIQSGPSTYTCQADGTWSPLPTCTIVSCPSYSVPNSVSPCPTTNYLGTCTIDCTPLFFAGRNQTKVCNATGHWSPEGSQTCTNIDCGTCAPVANNATTELPTGQTLETSLCNEVCDAGFSLFGLKTRVCNASGVWSPKVGAGASFAPPVCRKTCAPYAPPLNGYLDAGCAGVVSLFGQACTAACDVGYGINGPEGGDTVRVCGGVVEGAFSGSAPTQCPIVDCGALVLGTSPDPALWGGSVECSGTTYLESCLVRCEPGRAVNGNVTVDTVSPVCRADGSWGEDLACIPCQPGQFWQAEADRVGATAGLVCAPCPVGGVCDGGAAPPRASSGWFLNPDGSLQPCVPALACAGNNECASGFTGAICSACAASHFRSDDGTCKPCSPATVYLVFALLAFLVLMGVVLFRLAKKATAYFASLSVAFNFFQILAILSSFDLKWPKFVLDFLSFFKVFNFNVAIFNPKCAVSGGGGSPFLFVFYGKLLVPVISFGLLLVAICVIWVYYVVYTRVLNPAARYADEDDGGGRDAIAAPGGDDDDDGVGAGQLSVASATCFPYTSFRVAQEATWRSINAFISFLALVYLLVSATAMQIYACTRQVDGRVTLDAESAILCTSATYKRMRAVSVSVIVLFSLGLPVFILAILYVHRYDLWRYRTVALLGLLFQRYSSKFYYFEVFVLLRRFGFVLGHVLFPKAPLGQAVVALCAVVAAAVGQIMLKPYRAKAVNWLETMCMGFGIVCVCFGIMYFLADGSMPGGVSGTLGVILLVLICASILVIAVAIAAEIRKQWRLKHHGVAGGFASDQLEVFPSFFETDVYIHQNQRFRDGATTMYRISMSTPMDVQLSSVLILHRELISTDNMAWWQLLVPGLGPTASSTDNALALTAMKDNVRVVTYDGGRRHDVSVLLQRPAHYILSMRARRMEDYTPRSGGILVPASERSEELIDFFVSTESGSIAEQDFVVGNDLLSDHSGFIISPAQRILTLGSTYSFAIYVEGAKHVAVAASPPAHHTAAANKLLLKGGRHQGVFVPETPGPVAVWADFGTTARGAFDSIGEFGSVDSDSDGDLGDVGSSDGARRGSRARGSDFRALAWYDVVRQNARLIRNDVKRYSTAGLEDLDTLDIDSDDAELGFASGPPAMATMNEVELDALDLEA